MNRPKVTAKQIRNVAHCALIRLGLDPNFQLNDRTTKLGRIVSAIGIAEGRRPRLTKDYGPKIVIRPTSVLPKRASSGDLVKISDNEPGFCVGGAVWVLESGCDPTSVIAKAIVVGLGNNHLPFVVGNSAFTLKSNRIFVVNTKNMLVESKVAGNLVPVMIRDRLRTPSHMRAILCP